MQYYVLPIINYCSPVWSPILIFDITTVERVQRRYRPNKRVRELETMCYADRLQSLETLSLHRYRENLDMITVYKCLHGLMNCTPSSLGLSVITSNVRGCSIRLVQRRIVSRCRAQAVVSFLTEYLLDGTSCLSASLAL